MSELHYEQRPADGEPAGLLVLHHGRGTDEHDLLGLARVLDPKQRLTVVSPRGPLQLPGSPGYHWYVVERVGCPDPATFEQARVKLAELHDELWQQTGIPPERTVLGGFSQGTVMSYALALSADRPAPAGILALSGFIPTVDGWEPSLRDRTDLPVFISHGERDGVISVEFARAARDQLTSAGLPVEYHEHPGGHHLDPRQFDQITGWLEGVIGTA